MNLRECSFICRRYRLQVFCLFVKQNPFSYIFEVPIAEHVFFSVFSQILFILCVKLFATIFLNKKNTFALFIKNACVIALRQLKYIITVERS